MKNKRITILTRTFVARSKKGNWYTNEIESCILYNSTDLVIADKLEDLNKRKREHFFTIERDFNFKSVKGRVDFINYINETNEKNLDEELLKYKEHLNKIFEI